jgi:small subunit ribosomal protein S6
MRNYELMIILNPQLSESLRKEFVSKVRKMIEEAKGRLESVSELGSRDLAYKIKRETKGFYFLLSVALPADKISPIDRKIAIEESVLRHLLVRKD